MPATYFFKNASTIKYTGKGLKCGALHQVKIQETLQACGGLTRKALKAKLEAEEDKSWMGEAVASINDIVDKQLTRLAENDAIVAVKPGVAQAWEAAEAAGADHLAAKVHIKAVQKKAAAVKAKEYYLKQKAAHLDLKAKAEDLEAQLIEAQKRNAELLVKNEDLDCDNTYLQGENTCLLGEISRFEAQLIEAQNRNATLLGENAALLAENAAQALLLEKADDELELAETDLVCAKVECGLLQLEVKEEESCVDRLNVEMNGLTTEILGLRLILFAEFLAAAIAGLYLMAIYVPPQQQQLLLDF